MLKNVIETKSQNILKQSKSLKDLEVELKKELKKLIFKHTKRN